MTPERRRAACRVIKAAVSNADLEQQLLQVGHTREAIADAHSIGQGEDVPWVGIEPIPMRLRCPECCELHVDEGKFAIEPHHTHQCEHCGECWRPAVLFTVGVRFLFDKEKRS